VILAEVVGVGLSQLRTNKLRSFLTLLGIMIGVAAVIGIVALGEGLRRAVMGEFASRGGAGTVLVNPPQSYVTRNGRRVQRAWREYLTSDDMDAFFEASDRISAAVPGMGGPVQLRYGKTTISAQYTGTSEALSEVFSWPVAMGRNLSADDVRYARKACTITQRVLRELFSGRNPLGEEIKLNSERYTVVGVMSERIRSGRDAGNKVYIPYTTAQKRYTGNKHLYGITLFVDLLTAVDEVEATVKRVLQRRHEHGDEFRVRTSRQQMESADRTIGVMKLVAGGIAGISLLVGGIGIMNIMLVSVTERTREIGIRKALGAKPRHLLLQFVAEAVVLSMAGGALGVLGGVGLGLAIDKVIHHLAPAAAFSSVVSMMSVVWALAFSSVIGLFFGVYPAFRAARMDPVEALRYE
jgi:putative ABC transport system permease protein